MAEESLKTLNVELRRPDANRSPDAYRSFPYSSVEQVGEPHTAKSFSPEHIRILETIRNGVIGKDVQITTPFGDRQVTYCDYTASGRSLTFLEDYLRTEVSPLYSNTHTVSSSLGRQMTAYRAEARSIVSRVVHASKDDVVLFAGTGATGATMLLLHILGLRNKVNYKDEEDKRPVVVVGPYEHHTNILPWREAGAEVITAQEAEQGGVDCHALATTLARYSGRRGLKIGAFSAASNVSGILTDTESVTNVLQKNGFLAFFDFASAAPYTSVDMNPPGAFKDAIVFSPHKFVGGPGTPGILVIKKHLLSNRVPSKPGGGTVFFVSEDSHRYLQNFEEREEGGTPDVIGAVRCGLVLQLKEAVGSELIFTRERAFCDKALETWSQNENIIVLGQAPSSRRLPIFSLLFKHAASGLFLHHTFASCLLNDLFGIQSRSGCLCAGPYSLKLLGIEGKAAAFEQQLLQHDELSRPGFVRLNFNYFVSDEEVDFVIQAVRFVADHGWKFLPLYSFFVETGEWKHRKRQKFVDRKWLGHVSYKDGGFRFPPASLTSSEEEETDGVRYDRYLRVAHSQLSVKMSNTSMVDQSAFLKQGAKALRWYLLPSEALQCLQDSHTPAVTKKNHPIQPPLPFSYSSASSSSLSTILSSSSSSLSPPASASTSSPPPHHPSHLRPSSLTSSSKEKRFLMQQENTSQSPFSKAEKAASTVCRNCFHDHGSNPAISSILPLSENQKFSVVTGEPLAPPAPRQRCSSCQCVHFVPRSSISKKQVKLVERRLARLVAQASKQYSMLKEGDRVLIGVSGGKDSLTLVHILLAIKKRAPFNFDIGCVTVDPQTPEYDPSPLIPYFAVLGIPYFYESQGVLKLAETCMSKTRVSICAFCSRMKRGILYTTCRREGYNVLALGQHLDDLAESFVMSVFHNGCLRTMKANYHAAAGDLRIIRPLIFVRERLTREYATIADLPVINENCPACFEAPKERARVKLMLAEQEHTHPDIFQSLLKAMAPLMARENSALQGREDKVDPDSDEEKDTNPSTSLLKPVGKNRPKKQMKKQPVRKIEIRKGPLAMRTPSVAAMEANPQTKNPIEAKAGQLIEAPQRYLLDNVEAQQSRGPDHLSATQALPRFAYTAIWTVGVLTIGFLIGKRSTLPLDK